jgi:hypothetical protein
MGVLCVVAWCVHHIIRHNTPIHNILSTEVVRPSEFIITSERGQDTQHPHQFRTKDRCHAFITADGRKIVFTHQHNPPLHHLVPLATYSLSIILDFYNNNIHCKAETDP